MINYKLSRCLHWDGYITRKIWLSGISYHKIIFSPWNLWITLLLRYFQNENVLRIKCKMTKSSIWISQTAPTLLSPCTLHISTVFRRMYDHIWCFSNTGSLISTLKESLHFCFWCFRCHLILLWKRKCKNRTCSAYSSFCYCCSVAVFLMINCSLIHRFCTMFVF